jgi:sodium-dependent dicarboxylate transporter 2/3/5
MQILRILFARRWLIVGLLVSGILLLIPPPEGLTPQGMRALALLAMTMIFLITEPIPLPATALLIAVGQVFLGLGDSNQIAHSYMSDAVFFIMGSLMISIALVKQNLDKRVAFWLLRVTGPYTTRIVFGISAACALIASFIGEHTVAAMMLPVALGIIRAVEDDHKQARNLAVLLLLAISYGCAMGSLGTPSGGARNAIIIEYWRQAFGIHIDYATWIAYAYPMVLLRLPFVGLILLMTFRPEVTDLRRALVRLRRVVRESGAFSLQETKAVVLFGLVLFAWIAFSGQWGLGTIALTGAALFIIFGLVRWEDLNSGVNWGVVWLYAAAISLGAQLTATGAAGWMAQQVLALLGGTGGLAVILAVCILMILFTNVMSSGTAVAVLAPVTLQIAVLTGASIKEVGFVTALASAFGFLTVIGSPAAMIVYSSGYLKPSDYAKAGSKLLLLSVIMLVLLALFYWPLLGL